MRARSDQRPHDRRLLKENQRSRFEETTPKCEGIAETSDLSMTGFAVKPLGCAGKATRPEMYPQAISYPTVGPLCHPPGGNILTQLGQRERFPRIPLVVETALSPLKTFR